MVQWLTYLNTTPTTLGSNPGKCFVSLRHSQLFDFKILLCAFYLANAFYNGQAFASLGCMQM